MTEKKFIKTPEFDKYLEVLEDAGLDLNNLVLKTIIFAKDNELPHAQIYVNDLQQVSDVLEMQPQNGFISTEISGISFQFSDQPFEICTYETMLNQQLEQERNAKLTTMADFQNYKRRIQDQISSSGQQASKELLNEVIEVIDDAYRALEHISDKNDFTMLIEKLRNILSSQGLSELDIKVGTEFDPMKMEAITTTKTTDQKENNKVVHIESRGYQNNKGNVYRTAKVVIAKV